MSEHDVKKDCLEANVEKLLSRVDPELEMPEKDSERVLQALGVSGGSSSTRARSRRTLVEALAVATALLLVALVLSWSPDRGVAWADVVRQLAAVQSLQCSLSGQVDLVDEDAEQVGRGRLYVKDPGRVRVDVEQRRVGSPRSSELTFIERHEPESSTVVRILVQPERDYARRTTFHDVPEGLQFRPEEAARLWNLISRVRQQDGERIGARRIDGASTVGFEAKVPMSEYGFPFHLGGQAVVRVWVSEETALPVAMDLEAPLEDANGFAHYHLDAMRWNVALDDELFSIAAFQGYDVEERIHAVTRLDGARLSPAVRLRVPSGEGPDLLESADVLEVTSAEAEWDVAKPGESMDLTLWLRLTDTAMDTLRSVVDDPPNANLDVLWDGRELQMVVLQSWPEVAVDVTPLGLTVEQLEKRYLVR